MVEWFKKVERLDPGAALDINENSILADGGGNRQAQYAYFELIRRLIDMGGSVGRYRHARL